MTELETLIQKTRNWIEQDPDAETIGELEKLISDSDEAGLAERFGQRIGFGTAGLRGLLGAGPNRMNRVLVAQAAAGISKYLKENFDDPSVVIGYDARKNSDVFAKDSAQIFAGFGIRAFLFPELVATPLVAYAVRNLGASAGVMVTASHNPPGYNGYKVYDFSGSQIISPMDLEIAKHIDEFAQSESVTSLERADSFLEVPTSVRSGYLQSVSGLLNKHSTRKDIKIVYSAMHGVGASFIQEIFKLSGLAEPAQVVSQQQPDGKFPTVAFPNPEEPGAMDEAMATAASENADLVLVNDPDADRLAVAFRKSDGSYQQLTGDQLGLILGEEMAARSSRESLTGSLACSIVSSSALGKVAEYYGFGFEQTLTGFKWVSRVPNLIFGYEEALGYCVDWAQVRDKDGLSAALIVADIASALANQGYTLGDQLEKLMQRYGYFFTGQISIRVTDLTVIANLMRKLRTNPPSQIAGVDAVFEDLSKGSGSLPATDALRFKLADGRTVIIRPSGTEPKLKCYLQAVSDNEVDSKELLAELEAAMRQVLN
jgi:phosphomannomutase